MRDPQNEFEKWAVSNNFSIEIFNGTYFEKLTLIAHKGWKGKESIHNDIMYGYGICSNCKTHYRKVEHFGADNYFMECDCIVDRYRETKIMELMK